MAVNRKVDFIETVDKGIKEIGTSFKSLIVNIITKFADVLGEDIGKEWNKKKDNLIVKVSTNPTEVSDEKKKE